MFLGHCQSVGEIDPHGYHGNLLPHYNKCEDIYPATLSPDIRYPKIQEAIVDRWYCLSIMAHRRAFHGHLPMPPLLSGL